MDQRQPSILFTKIMIFWFQVGGCRFFDMKYLPEVEALFDECRVTKVWLCDQQQENYFKFFLQEFWVFCKVQVVHANEYRVSDKASEDILYPNTAHLQVHQRRNIQMFCKCTISNTTWVSGLGYTPSDLKTCIYFKFLSSKFKVDKLQMSPQTLMDVNFGFTPLYPCFAFSSKHKNKNWQISLKKSSCVKFG